MVRDVDGVLEHDLVPARVAHADPHGDGLRTGDPDRLGDLDARAVVELAVAIEVPRGLGDLPRRGEVEVRAQGATSPRSNVPSGARTTPLGSRGSTRVNVLRTGVGSTVPSSATARISTTCSPNDASQLSDPYRMHVPHGSASTRHSQPGCATAK
ncbi:MAG TPA: hypothetical protein VN238_06455 [Solirubrobacteraceae bacterium]|nr:hypothetical protein [Solirubrobacteraceae bacterium]